MTSYDQPGITYNQTRQADARIITALLKALDLPHSSILADIGAGTGNYSLELAKAGFQVHAVEPSAVMRQQGGHHPHLHWHAAQAEALPFEDASLHGIISTLAVHHFQDPTQSFSQMARVVRKHGPIVLFVADPRLCPQDCWLADYFQPIFQHSYDVYRPLPELQQRLSACTGSAVDVQIFLLPDDLTDHFFLSGWRSPECYLMPTFRRGISPLAQAPSKILEPCLQRLAHDLKSGKWQSMYGSLLPQKVYDGGYRFLIAHKETM